MRELNKPVNIPLTTWLVGAGIILILLLPGLILPVGLAYSTPAEVDNTEDELAESFAKQPLEQRTRGARTTVEIENNNHPWNATLITSSDESVRGTVSSGSDSDWFKKKLKFVINEPGEDRNYLQNLTLRLNSWSAGSDTGESFQVLVYGWMDINQNDKEDWESEMIFMKAQHFMIGFSSTEIVWVNSYHTEFYYILFRTKDAKAVYDFQLTVLDIEDPGETNQNILHASGISASPLAPVVDKVEIGSDPFDWFLVPTSSTTNTIGLNFTLDMKVTGSLPVESELVDGKTVDFVTVLHILVYHEDKPTTGGRPKFQFRAHLIISQHPYTGYRYNLQYHDIITLPTHLFKKTYLGIYVESYGMVRNKQDEKVYPYVNDIADYTQGWIVFTIEDADTSKIHRPELYKISVESTSTNSIYGYTYDSYKYTVWYKQSENLPPTTRQVSVFGLEGEIRETMVKVSKKTGADKVYRDGCKYEFTFSGGLLGEGNHHIYQLHFKDRNAWAIGTIELGKSWHGPYISNNIRPYIRPTAPTKLTLYEDDNTTFFDLNSIFEDADVYEELNFTIAEPETNSEDRVWGKSYSNSILDAEIINDTRLKIDLKPNKFGQTKVLLNVSDIKYYYLNSTFEFTINVLPVNDPPQVIKYFTKITLKEDQIDNTIILYDHFDDPIDGDELSFRVENNRNIDVWISEDGFVMLTPKPNWYGKEYIDFFASDGLAEVSDYLEVIVKSKNDAPVIDINETIELWQDQWANFTINVVDAADNESVIIGQNLTQIFPYLEKTPEKYGYSFDNDTGYITLKPTNNMVGTYSWNISAIDVNNAMNFTHVKLIIHNVNDPPVPDIIFPMNGARYLTTDKISFRGRVSDPDKALKNIETDPITLTWYSTLRGERTKIGTGLNLEPQLYEEGTHTIRLIADDGEYARNASIVIHVFAIDRKLDTDGDGIPDYWENLYNINTKDPRDGDEDFDSDTFSNWEEYKGQSDPRDPNSMPAGHYDREVSEEDKLLLTAAGVFGVLIVILIIIILWLMIKSRRRSRKEKAEKERLEKEKAEAAEKDGKKPYYGKYKPPKVVCHECGASFEVLTLNRPVAITCNQCGTRGVIYK